MFRLPISRASLALLPTLLCCVVLCPATASAARMTLTWTDNSSNETGFRIERATGSSGTFAVVATTTSNVTTYVDDNLSTGTLYRYRLRAFNSAGNSAYSAVVSATTPVGNTAPTLSAIANRSMIEDGSSGEIPFVVADAETSPGSLGLSASSSNIALIPESSILFGGTAGNRTITLKPAANRSGTATITVKVTDGSLSATRSFVATVTAVNDAPTVSNIADRAVTSGGTTGAVSFTVGDVETAAGSLSVSATSSNTTLVPASGITLGGTGANRTITVKPASGRTGTATITVKVSDGALSATDSFVVTVTSSTTTTTTTNTAPTISSIAAKSVPMNSTSPAIPFTVGDAQTAAGNLKVTASVSNASLLPASNVTLAGTGANRTVTLRPLSNTTGACTVTLTVSDGSLSAKTSFVVNVSANLTGVDVGSPKLAGRTTSSGSSVQIVAAGADIAYKNDEFHFAHARLSGDSELTVRVATLVNTHGWAKAGLMYRSSTDANSPFVMVCATPTNGIWLYARKSSTTNAFRAALVDGTAPKWLKLTRVGDTFYSFHSENGVDWDLIDSVTIDLPDTSLAGLGVTSHVWSKTTTAKFEDFQID